MDTNPNVVPFPAGYRSTIMLCVLLYIVDVFAHVIAMTID